MVIKIPEKLNGNSFYNEILPNTYDSILKKEFPIDFDMTNTKLANPEGFVNLFATALLLRNKYNFIPRLYPPLNKNLFAYMLVSNFFKMSNVPLCEIFSYNFEIDSNNEMDNFERFVPKLQGIFVHSNYNNHFDNIDNIIKNINLNLAKNDKNYDMSFFPMLQSSLNQLVKNTIEHNPNYKEYGALGFYMAQKTPYNTIEFAFSDVGQGFRNRMIEMLNKGDVEARNKYSIYEKELNDDTYLFQQHTKNPNLIAIQNAIEFRSDSQIPGLFQIKQFAIKNGGYFQIHSGNYTVKYEQDKTQSWFHESYFSGCHLKVEIPLITN